MEIKRSYIKKALTVMVLAAMFVLFVQFSPSGDDWMLLAEENGLLQAFRRAVKARRWLNGRVLGNFMHAAWVYRIPGILLRLLAFAGFGEALARLLRDRAVAYLLLAAAILFLPPPIFRETWVWSAGFFNYVPPTVLLLLLFLLFQKKTENNRRLHVLLFFISLSASLFMENITVYLAVISPFVLFWHRNDPELRTRSLLFLAGSWLGALVMFTSPGYAGIASDADSYRRLEPSVTGLFAQIEANWNTMFSRFLIAENTFLLCTITVTASWLVLRTKALVQARVALALLWLSGIVLYATAEPPGTALFVPNLLLHLLFFLTILWIGAILLRGNLRRHFLFFWLALPLVMGSLLPVSPVGARNFFFPTMIGLLLVALWLRQLLQTAHPYARIILCAVLVALCSIQCIKLIPIHHANLQVTKERIHLAEQAVNRGAAEAKMPAYPHPEYIHHATDPHKMGYLFYHKKRLDIRFFQ